MGLATVLMALAVGLSGQIASGQTGPAVTLGPPNNLFGGSGGSAITQGWQFKPNSDITITELGFFDGSLFSDVGLAEPHDVAIYNSTGQVVVSATIPPALFDKINTWFVSVPETHLSVGEIYTGAAFFPAPKVDPV